MDQQHRMGRYAGIRHAVYSKKIGFFANSDEVSNTVTAKEEPS